MKKLILTTICENDKKQKDVVIIAETKSLIDNRYCLKTLSKHYRNNKLSALGTYEQYFDTYESMHVHYEFVKKVNTGISKSTKIKEKDF